MKLIFSILTIFILTSTAFAETSPMVRIVCKEVASNNPNITRGPVIILEQTERGDFLDVSANFNYTRQFTLKYYQNDDRIEKVEHLITSETPEIMEGEATRLWDKAIHFIEHSAPQRIMHVALQDNHLDWYVPDGDKASNTFKCAEPEIFQQEMLVQYEELYYGDSPDQLSID